MKLSTSRAWLLPSSDKWKELAFGGTALLPEVTRKLRQLLLHIREVNSNRSELAESPRRPVAESKPEPGFLIHPLLDHCLW